MPDITGEVLPELEIESADIAVSIKGDKGDPGDDGHTPVITATKLDGVTTIFVDGNPVATVQDGLNGVSPVITATKSGNTLTIYANGVVIGRVQDGEDIRGGKTELRYAGTGNVITRSSDGASVSFREILDYLRVSPDFTYLLYGERAYLPTLINDDDQGMHYVYFESTMVDGGMSKNAVIRIVSNDGETIAGISTSNVANENYNNKVAQITAQNKASTGSYTSVKAVVDYVESEALLGDVDMSRGEEIPHVGYDDTEIRQELSRQFESITEIKDSFAKKTDIPTVPTQVSQLENDAGYLTEHQTLKTINGQSLVGEGNVVVEGGSGGGGITDVQVNGTSVVADGVANVPKADNNTLGVAKVNALYGTTVINDSFAVSRSADTDIDTRSQTYKPIVPKNLDYAVKAAMCDGKGAAWTEAEQQAAQQRLGISSSGGGENDVRKIASVTLEEDTQKLYITKDLNGNDFSLSEIYLKIYATPYGSASAENWLQVYAENTTSGNSKILQIGSFGKNNKYAFAHLKLFDIWRVLSVVHSTNATGDYQNALTMTNQIILTHSDPATAVSIYAYIGIGAGSVIEVWGR